MKLRIAVARWQCRVQQIFEYWWYLPLKFWLDTSVQPCAAYLEARPLNYPRAPRLFSFAKVFHYDPALDRIGGRRGWIWTPDGLLHVPTHLARAAGCIPVFPPSCFESQAGGWS